MQNPEPNHPTGCGLDLPLDAVHVLAHVWHGSTDGEQVVP